MQDFYTGNVAQVGGGLTDTLGSSVWWSLFWALLIFFLIYSTILLYHWFKFGMRRRSAVIAATIYLGVSVLLIFIMLASVISVSVV